MLCQRCGKTNPNDAETCRSCGYRLLALLSSPAEEAADAREMFGVDEGAPLRLQALEKQARRLADEVQLLVHAMDYLERSVTADRAGIHALVQILRERGLLDPGEFGRRWLDRAARNLAELALKDRFMEQRDLFSGAFRGKDSKGFEERVDRAEDLFFLLDSRGALAVLEEAIALDPENLPLAAFVGECLLERRDLPGARRLLAPAASSKAPPKHAAVAWARLLLREGEPSEAAAYLEARLRAAPEDAEMLTHLALARGLTEAWEACSEAAERALRAQVAPAALYLLAHAHLRLERISAAEEQLARLVALDSTCEEAFLQQALLHIDRGHWNRARRVLERLQTLDPDRSAEAILDRFRRADRRKRRLSRVLPLKLDQVLDIMGSARGEARLLLRKAESEIR